jgi:hypothetical protein
VTEVPVTFFVVVVEAVEQSKGADQCCNYWLTTCVPSAGCFHISASELHQVVCKTRLMPEAEVQVKKCFH